MTEKYKPTDVEIFEARAPGLPAASETTDIVMAAIQRNLDPALIEKMMDLAERNERNVAKKGHFSAVAKFKKNIPTVIKDALNASKNPYATAGNLLGAVNPVLAEYGLSVNFKIKDSEDHKFMTVTAILSHELGHSDESSMTFEIETTGAKGAAVMTKTHARMSTLTYAIRGTFSAVVGIAAIDPKHDDDGFAATAPEYITEDQQIEIQDQINDIYPDKGAKFFKWLKVESVETIPADQYKKAINGLRDAQKALDNLAKQDREPGQEG
jgi:hypothetical protein